MSDSTDAAPSAVTDLIVRDASDRGELAALATKHGKESLFGPAFASIGWSVEVSSIDTDMFGTFSGEIERSASARHVVEHKARAGAEATGLRFGLASEGSFGQHPGAPFALVDEELVAWVDTSCEHVVVERAIAISRVPPSVRLDPTDDPGTLRIVSEFPAQGAIVVHERDDRRSVVDKGITDLDRLREAVERAHRHHGGHVVVEPDLRAHMCPDRRGVIAEAIERLAARIATRCPVCDARGLGVMRSRAGLACALCGLPTRCTAADIIGCSRCGHESESVRSGSADPTHCDRCNP